MSNQIKHNKAVSMTKVYNLLTGVELIYSISPQAAVIAAWEQDRGNFNTWTYERSKAPVEHGRFSVTAGDWTALQRRDEG